MTGFGQVSLLSMIQHLFSSYGTIDEIYLEENDVNMMGTYNPTEPIARFIKKLKKGREFTQEGGQTISDSMMV